MQPSHVMLLVQDSSISLVLIIIRIFNDPKLLR